VCAGMTVLRSDLLKSRAIALTGGTRPGLSDALTSLGASVVVAEGDAVSEEWARDRDALDVLMYDAGRAFGTGAEDGLRTSLEQAWEAIHAVASGALIPGERGGKIVLIGPRPDAGPHVDAARAALENLARTLSVEWARYRITVTMVAPGVATSDEELETLLAFLASAAGDYFTGCRFELGSV
jgi:NAD(P)-dependent dehydrogenase (short-subunit alcohol dehydrogenase family)